MNRDSISIFFKYDNIGWVADELNKVVKENRQLNIMIDSIGILKQNCTVEITQKDSVKEIDLPSGYGFISISGEGNLGHEIIHWLDNCDFEIKIISKALLPIENFLIENEDDEKMFCKRIKSRLITEGHISEIHLRALGIFQNTEHSDDLTRVDDLLTYYITSDDYIITLADDEKLSPLPENMAPSFRVHKIGCYIDFIVPRKEYEYICTECYILEHIEDWKEIVDGLNNILKDKLEDKENDE